MILLVVDAQEMLMNDKLYNFNLFKENVEKLITHARKCGVEVVFVRHDDGTELTKGAKGFEVYNSFAPKDGEKIFDKNYNSAFRKTGLTEYLRGKNENEIMIVGLQTDYCMDATVKCGFEHGFTMIVPAFCNTTVDNEFMTGEQSYRYYNQKMWNGRYAKCIGFDDALSYMGK